jgi:hypothetical protein
MRAVLEAEPVLAADDGEARRLVHVETYEHAPPPHMGDDPESVVSGRGCPRPLSTPRPSPTNAWRGHQRNERQSR